MPATPEIAASAPRDSGMARTCVMPAGEKGRARDVEARMVEREDAAHFFSREGKNLFGKQQKQKNHHAQQEVVGVKHGKRRFACKAIQFGELTVEHASGHAMRA